MKNEHFGFNSKNYRLLFIGLAVNIIGFLLMIGGGADQLNEFNADELFSQRRITLAPFFIVVGYVIIIVAIMRRPKSIAINQEEIAPSKTSKNKK
tara:strand:+ start:175 stop:459 length:285 start_codon:yes stop_codon:yes gene_type:complete